MKFNLNDKVTVRLTAWGQQVYERELIPAWRTANDGVLTTELWHLMSLFGREMYNGARPLFTDNFVEIERR